MKEHVTADLTSVTEGKKVQLKITVFAKKGAPIVLINNMRVRECCEISLSLDEADYLGQILKDGIHRQLAARATGQDRPKGKISRL